MQLKKKKQLFLIVFIIILLACGATTFILLNKSNESITSPTPSEPPTEGVSPFDGIKVINDNRGVPILCYHHVNDDPNKNSITVSREKFTEHIKTLKDNGYTTLTMSQLDDYLLNNKPIPEKSVMITFDDGYSDNYTNAFPILKEFDMNATIFVISNLLDTTPYMNSSQVKELSDYGIDIQSHTVNHADLATLSYENQLKELTDSKVALEKITGKPIISIAYPLGHFNEDSKKAAKEAGYSMGFTIDRGYADRDDSPVQLNRICVDYTYKSSDILKVLKNLPK